MSKFDVLNPPVEVSPIEVVDPGWEEKSGGYSVSISYESPRYTSKAKARRVARDLQSAINSVLSENS